MRLPGRAFEDPVLRFGAAALALALLFAAAVAAYALLRERPAEAANRTVSTAASAEPLVRSDPGVDPWAEEDVPPPRVEPERGPEPTGHIMVSDGGMALQSFAQDNLGNPGPDRRYTVAQSHDGGYYTYRIPREKFWA